MDPTPTCNAHQPVDHGEEASIVAPPVQGSYTPADIGKVYHDRNNFQNEEQRNKHEHKLRVVS